VLLLLVRAWEGAVWVLVRRWVVVFVSLLLRELLRLLEGLESRRLWSVCRLCMVGLT